jgi:hypothetical protein
VLADPGVARDFETSAAVAVAVAVAGAGSGPGARRFGAPARAAGQRAGYVFLCLFI